MTSNETLAVGEDESVALLGCRPAILFDRYTSTGNLTDRATTA